jgi:hypothetical protein
MIQMRVMVNAVDFLLFQAHKQSGSFFLILAQRRLTDPFAFVSRPKQWMSSGAASSSQSQSHYHQSSMGSLCQPNTWPNTP